MKTILSLLFMLGATTPVVYAGPAQPLAGEKDPVALPGFAGLAKIHEENGTYILSLNLPPNMQKNGAVPVTTEPLGTFHITKLPLVQPDGSPLTIDTDFTGAKRDAKSPPPGPFETVAPGRQTIRVR